MATQEVARESGGLPREQRMAECEVCGRKVCECPHPLGECVECCTPIFAGDPWMVDSEGGHWCARCWPGGEA